MHFSLKCNEEMVSQDLHLCDTDTENTSLLANNSNISLLIPPDTLMVITFAGALWQALLCIRSRTLQLRWRSPLLMDTKHCGAALDSLLLFPPARQFFSSLIDGCLKYKHKEKPKTGPRPGPRLNYDVKIGPIEAWSGPGWNAGL